LLELQSLDATHAFCSGGTYNQRPASDAVDVSADIHQRFCGSDVHHSIASIDEVVQVALAENLLLVLELKPGIDSSRAPAQLAALFSRYPDLYDRAVVLCFYPWLLYSVCPVVSDCLPILD
jgi:hypothetical protein